MRHPDFDGDITIEGLNAYCSVVPCMEVDGGRGFVIDDDFGRLTHIHRLESCLASFARTGRFDRVRINEALVNECKSKQVMNYDSCMVLSMRLGRLSCFWDVNTPEFRYLMGDAIYSPMVELYFRLLNAWLAKYPFEPGTNDTEAWLRYFREKVAWTNAFLDELYAALNTRRLMEEQSHQRRCSRKNYRSACDYVDNLISRRSKLLVLRLDLGYRRYRKELDMSRLESADGVTAERTIDDRDRFIKLLKKRFEGSWLGYIWKLEYQPRKGFHYHLFIFLDGHKCLFDYRLADEAGHIWVNDVTLGVGVYFNCNRNAASYRENGTGMLQRSDKDKILALKKAVGYLTKIDLLVRSRLLVKRRIFGKGEMVLGSKKAEDVRAAWSEQRRAAKRLQDAQAPKKYPF
jgi:hypothetical protein